VIDEPRDLFVVHTKGNERERALYDALVPRLEAVGITSWAYEDWEWTHERPRGGGARARSSGSLAELDPLRYASGHPEPFRARMIEQVDDHTLAEMLHGCSVILLCEPLDGEPSEGVHVERRVLAGLSSGPALVRIAWPDSTEGYFDKLHPVLTLQAADADATRAVADEAFAAVVAAWLVGRLCRMSMEGGPRLLAEVRGADDRLRTLIDGHPAFVEPAGGPSQAPDGIRAIFARMAGVGAERFETWWTTEAAALKDAAAELASGGPNARVLETLIAGIDASYRRVLGLP
jgi:hypothetical protein